MRTAHALNSFDSLHTMIGMDSSKPSGPRSPLAAHPLTASARRQSLQLSAIDSIQLQRCQQPSQQQ